MKVYLRWVKCARFKKISRLRLNPIKSRSSGCQKILNMPCSLLLRSKTLLSPWTMFANSVSSPGIASCAVTTTISTADAKKRGDLLCRQTGMRPAAPPTSGVHSYQDMIIKNDPRTDGFQSGALQLSTVLNVFLLPACTPVFSISDLFLFFWGSLSFGTLFHQLLDRIVCMKQVCECI